MTSQRRKYFTSQDVPVKMDYDEVYLKPQRDPDGVMRDPYQERDRKLEDLHQELAFVNNLTPGKILDVGCGLGFFLSGVTSSWDRHGQEVSRPCVEYAKKFCTAFCGTLEEAAYPDNHFDVVVSMSVIEHIPDPLPTIRDMWRVLKPGGKLVLRTPNFDSGVARRFGAQYRLLIAAGHVTLFSDTTLRRLLEDTGFQIDKVEYPFFESRHFTLENLKRLFDVTKVSPPFYGNHMCFYATKPQASHVMSWSRGALAELDEWIETHANQIETAAMAISANNGNQSTTEAIAKSDNGVVVKGANSNVTLPTPPYGHLGMEFLRAALDTVIQKNKPAD